MKMIRTILGLSLISANAAFAFTPAQSALIAAVQNSGLTPDKRSLGQCEVGLGFGGDSYSGAIFLDLKINGTASKIATLAIEPAYELQLLADGETFSFGGSGSAKITKGAVEFFPANAKPIVCR